MPTTFDEAYIRDYCKRTGQDPQKYLRPGKAEGEKRSKYGNIKTTVDGITFDSKHEAEIYRELNLMVKTGEYLAAMRQIPFYLPGSIRYIADFVVLKKDGSFAVLDAKSEATRRDKVYRIKKKLMKESLGLDIQEV